MLSANSVELDETPLSTTDTIAITRQLNTIDFNTAHVTTVNSSTHASTASITPTTSNDIPTASNDIPTASNDIRIASNDIRTASNDIRTASTTTITSRMVMTKMALENFKSYAGVKEIGPFHKVHIYTIITIMIITTNSITKTISMTRASTHRFTSVFYCGCWSKWLW